MKSLMIVAHPDDEILFGYTALSQGDWHVVCMTNKNHPVRYPEFQHSMQLFGASYEIWDYPDRWGEGFEEARASIDIGCVLMKGFNRVLTHNQFGEYGHTQHASLNAIVTNLVDRNLYVFGQDKSKTLSFNVLQKKMEAMTIYKSQIALNAFDWYDNNQESNRMMNYVVSEHHARIK